MVITKTKKKTTARKKSPASTKMTVLSRVNAVYKILREGGSRKDCMQKKTVWNVEERQIDEYIRRAYELYKDHINEEQGTELHKMIAQLDLLFFQSIKAKDRRAALGALKQKAELLGLEAPKKVKVEKMTPLTDDEKDDLIAEYVATKKQ